MKPFLVLLTALFALALPVGLATELVTAYGLNSLAFKASTVLRKQYPLRRQLTQELAVDPRIATEQIDEWEWQALRSLDQPVSTTLPYTEQWLVTQQRTQAVVFTVSVGQGRILEITSERQSTAQDGLIVEVFELEGSGSDPVTAMGPEDEFLRWPVSGTSSYRIRVQSTPGTVGAFSLVLDERFPLDFPVLTDSPDPVKSFFGMPRDGGRRKHHGIDIFAPRHTPVVAAADGYISRVGTVNIRTGPGTDHDVEDTISRGEIVSVQAATNGWLRILTGAGVAGFVADTLVGTPQEKSFILPDTTTIQATPAASSPILVQLPAGQVVALSGRYGSARRVETDTGLRGWMIDTRVQGDDEPTS